MTAKFVGSYVDDIVLACIAGLASQEHVAIMGLPGCGKTAIADRVVTKVVGENHRIFIRFAPSTPPQKVEGMFDPQAALSNPPRFVLERKGSMFDPNARSLLLDEFFRASDIVFDIGLDGLDRRDIPADQIPVAICTANFATTAARNLALNDRIALWHWVRPGVANVNGIIDAFASQMDGVFDVGDVPTWDEIVAVRKAVPGPHAIKLCKEILTLLAQEASKASLIPNNRRTKQWFRLLYRTNVLYQQTADFSHSNVNASKVLSWAWALTDESKASEWSKIAGCVVDVVGTALAELKKNALEQIKIMLSQSKNEPRSAMAIKLGEIIAENKREISELGKDDKRVKQVMDDLEQVFVKITRGENPFA